MDNNKIIQPADVQESGAEFIRPFLDMTDKGQIKQNLNNCTFILKNDPVLKDAFRRNILTGLTDTVRPLPWLQRSQSVTDTDVNNIRLYMEQKYEISSEKNIWAAIDIVANENTYHPVAEKLKSLTWDGVPRINTALHHFLGAEESDYTAEVMRLHMLAAIHRVFSPGCKYDICLVFVGNQGGGKSTFLRFLAIEDEWFTDDMKNLNDSKIYERLQGHWIVELSEMSAARKADVEEIKAFLSRQKDNYRMPYSRTPEDRLRQCVVCGTSNNPRFLPLDRTGNRRFAPVMVDSEKAEVHPLDDEKKSREYILQMWAEAMELYAKEVSEGTLRLTFSKEMEEYAKQMQKDCMKEDVAYGMLEAYLELHEDERVCCAMIADEVFGVDDPKKQNYDVDKYTEILRLCGWKCINSRRFAKYGGQKAWIKTGGILDPDVNAFADILEEPVDIPF